MMRIQDPKPCCACVVRNGTVKCSVNTGVWTAWIRETGSASAGRPRNDHVLDRGPTWSNSEDTLPGPPQRRTAMGRTQPYETLPARALFPRFLSRLFHGGGRAGLRRRPRLNGCRRLERVNRRPEKSLSKQRGVKSFLFLVHCLPGPVPPPSPPALLAQVEFAWRAGGRLRNAGGERVWLGGPFLNRRGAVPC